MWFKIALIFICVATCQSICDQYSQSLVLTNQQFMTTIVSEVVNTILSNSSLLPYHNGKSFSLCNCSHAQGQIPPGSTDFTNASNSALLNAMINGKVQYFGGLFGISQVELRSSLIL
jgi:hypothetical protein